MQMTVRAWKVLSDSLSATPYHIAGVSINARWSFRLMASQIWSQIGHKSNSHDLDGVVYSTHENLEGLRTSLAPGGEQFMEMRCKKENGNRKCKFHGEHSKCCNIVDHWRPLEKAIVTKVLKKWFSFCRCRGNNMRKDQHWVHKQI